MAWLLIEDGRLLNTELVTHVEFRDIEPHKGKATCWGYGVIMCGESKIAADFFEPIRADILKKRQGDTQLEEPDGSGVEPGGDNQPKKVGSGAGLSTGGQVDGLDLDSETHKLEG